MQFRVTPRVHSPLLSDIFAGVFGKKRRLNSEMNPRFCARDRVSSTRVRKSPELQKRRKLGTLPLQPWVSIEHNQVKKKPNFFQKNEKKVDIR